MKKTLILSMIMPAFYLPAAKKEKSPQTASPQYAGISMFKEIIKGHQFLAKKNPLERKIGGRVTS